VANIGSDTGFNWRLVVRTALERASLTGRPGRRQSDFAIGSPGVCNMFAMVSNSHCLACSVILQRICSSFAIVSPYFRNALASAIASSARAQQLERRSAVTFCKCSATAPQHICHGFKHSLPCLILQVICTHFATLSPCFRKSLAKVFDC
jgi:hypothetical protein